MKINKLIYLKELNTLEWEKIIQPLKQDCKLYIDEESDQIFSNIPPNFNTQNYSFICDFKIGDKPETIIKKIINKLSIYERVIIWFKTTFK